MVRGGNGIGVDFDPLVPPGAETEASLAFERPERKRKQTGRAMQRFRDLPAALRRNRRAVSSLAATLPVHLRAGPPPIGGGARLTMRANSAS